MWAERSLFRVLGVAPAFGRTFTENDPPDVVVLSASLWKRRFGADPACIGRRISLSNEPFTIIGVMPESFQFPYRAALTEMWIPWSMARAACVESQLTNRLRRRPPEARRDHRSSAPGAQPAGKPAGRAISSHQSGTPCPPHASRRIRRRTRARRAAHLTRRRRTAPADRLRECRQPAAGARRRKDS